MAQTAPDKSPRPKKNPARGKPKVKSPSRNYRTSAQTNPFADAEFRADLDSLLRNDPIARLGFEGGVKFIDQVGPDGTKALNRIANYIPKDHNSSGELELLSFLNEGYPVERDDVAYSSDYGASKDVIVHEMRHRGISRLKDMYSEDPKWFAEEFGEEAASIIGDLTHDEDETLTEVGDNPEATWVDPRRGVRSMSETLTHNANETGKTIYDQLQKAADYALSKKEPPKSVPKEEKSWLGQLLTGKKYAEGGVVKPLEQQMQFNFMKGGPVETDPVSGNEVPPGGTPEGVRDNIPAKVSEGEFIFPENVVRFYGIDKLEKMIQKANETLAQMEDAGRMGNPDEAEEEQLPFDVSELQTAEDEGPIQMAAGGPVLTAQPGGGYQQVQYVNANGDKRLVILYNGVPINGMIPAGYFPDTPENRKSLQQGTDQQEDPSVKAVSRNTDFMENRNDSNQGTKAKPVGEWTTEDFENMVTQQKTVDLISKGLGLAGGPAGLAAGLALKGVNNLTQRQAREEILNRINNPETPQEAKDRLNAVYQKLEEPEEEEGGIFGGEGLLGDLFGGDGLLGGIFKSSRTSTDPKNTSGPKSPSTASTGSGYRTSSSPIVSPRPASRSGGSGDFGENRGGPSSSRSENVQASSSWSGSGSGGRTNVSSSFRDTYGSADTASRNSSDYSTGVGDREDKTTSGGLSFGFKKGGLVTRRKK